MALSKDEMDLVRGGRELADMMRTPGWKVLERILQSHIDTRMQKLLMPLHDFQRLSGVSHNGVAAAEAMDGQSAVLAQECIKGALIGLRLALSMPSTIVNEADALRARATQGEDHDDDA